MLSAYVWSFAAKPANYKLVHHNVFFNINYKKEFQDINEGIIPTDPILYVCTQGNNKDPTPSSTAIGGFEIIINAASISNPKSPDKHEEFKRCKNTTFPILESMGLKLKLSPKKEMLTTLFEFDKLFPGSSKSLYGRNPHGINSTFKKPLSQSQIKGLLVARRRNPSRSRSTDGMPIRQACGRNNLTQPKFDVIVEKNGYACWCVDGISIS